MFWDQVFYIYYSQTSQILNPQRLLKYKHLLYLFIHETYTHLKYRELMLACPDNAFSSPRNGKQFGIYKKTIHVSTIKNFLFSVKECKFTLYTCRQRNTGRKNLIIKKVPVIQHKRPEHMPLIQICLNSYFQEFITTSYHQSVFCLENIWVCTHAVYIKWFAFQET